MLKKRLLFDSRCNMAEISKDESYLNIGKDIEKIDDNFIYNHPSMVVVNLTGKTPTFSSGPKDKSLHPNLDPDEISSMGKLNDLMWLNIKGPHWKEICQGNIAEPNAVQNPVDPDTVTRNIMDYLDLQKTLWKSRFTQQDQRKNPLIFDSHHNNNRSSHTVKMSERRNSTKSKFWEENLLPDAEAEFEDVLAIRKLLLNKKGIFERLADGFDICFNIQYHNNNFQKRIKDPAFICKAIILCLLNIVLFCWAFVIFTPMFYTESEYRNKFPNTPTTFLEIMSCISKHVSIFPVKLSTVFPKPPPKSPNPNGWYSNYAFATKLLQIFNLK